jgi:hypothetical protein
VLVIWNFNDTILQKENASVFQAIVCGEVALCHLVIRYVSASGGTGFSLCLFLYQLFDSFLSP